MKTEDSAKIIQLRTLLQLAALVNSSLDIGEVRKRSVDAAIKLADAEAGSLLFIDADTGQLYFDVALGEKGGQMKRIRLEKGQGIAGWVADHGEAVIINDVQSDPRFFRGADMTSSFETRSMLCLPVRSKRQNIGVLQVINKRDGVFVAEDMELLTALTNQVAIAIENARLFEQQTETFYETVHAFAETIEKRDPYTGGHLKRVTTYCLAIGKIMGLSQKDLTTLRLASVLHDIGKVCIKDDVLLKPGNLDSDEYKTMIAHAVHGADILHHIKQLRDIVPGVRYHHEKFDGSGYPDGLKDGEIPITARIIAVADTFDAMTTDRPYRKGLGVNKALDELKKYAGTQFDPDVVDAFMKACREGEIDVKAVCRNTQCPDCSVRPTCPI